MYNYIVKGENNYSSEVPTNAGEYTVKATIAAKGNYESAEATELVMNTADRGTGYYATMGTVIKIRWEASESGSLCFYTEDGEKLTVNRGSSYIGFVKSSLHSSVKFN